MNDENWCNNIADAIDAALALEGGIDAVFPNYSDDRNFSQLNYILMDVISIGGKGALESVLDGFISVTNSITDHLGLNNQSDITDICALIEQQAAVNAIYVAVQPWDGSVNDENWCNNIADAIDAALALEGGIDAVFQNYSDDRNFPNSTIY